MTSRLTLLVPALLALGATGAGAASAALPSPSAVRAGARLEGAYRLTGTVTQALGVPGERRGQSIVRTWLFTSPCASGACPLLRLGRQRATGVDQLFLHQRQPGVYAGQGAFLAPARCRGRLYRRGLLVPYTITLTVTAAATRPDGSVLATGFAASYRNPYRIGLSPCFSAPSYDSARYTGSSLPAPAGSIRTVRSTRSSSGS